MVRIFLSLYLLLGIAVGGVMLHSSTSSAGDKVVNWAIIMPVLVYSSPFYETRAYPLGDRSNRYYPEIMPLETMGFMYEK